MELSQASSFLYSYPLAPHLTHSFSQLNSVFLKSETWVNNISMKSSVIVDRLSKVTLYIINVVYSSREINITMKMGQKSVSPVTHFCSSTGISDAASKSIADSGMSPAWPWSVADSSEANSCHFCSISSAVRFTGAARNTSSNGSP